MSGCLVLDLMSIIDTESLLTLVTKTVLPSGVTANETGNAPTAMSSGSLVLVLTSIVDTDSLSTLTTTAVTRHRVRPATADTASGTTPARAPANPSTTTRPAHRDCDMMPTPSPVRSGATRRDRHPDRDKAHRDVVRVLAPGLAIDGGAGVAAVVCDQAGLAVGRNRHPTGLRADGDVGRVLGPCLHVDGRDGAEPLGHRRGRRWAEVGDEGGLAVGGDYHRSRAGADGDVGGVLGPGLHINRRDRAAAVIAHVDGLPVGCDGQPQRLRTDCDVGWVFGFGLHVNRRDRVATEVGDEDGLAVGRGFHAEGARADGDVGAGLGPGLHINRRDRAASAVGDED